MREQSLPADIIPPGGDMQGGIKAYFLYGIWGPGRYLDGSGTKNRAKLMSRIQIWTILGPNSMIFIVLGIFGNRGVFLGKHFSKKSISYETSGQTHKLKRLVYGSSGYDLFKKKVDSIGKLHSDSRILVGTLFFI